MIQAQNIDLMMLCDSRQQKKAIELYLVRFGEILTQIEIRNGIDAYM